MIDMAMMLNDSQYQPLVADECIHPPAATMHPPTIRTCAGETSMTLLGSSKGALSAMVLCLSDVSKISVAWAYT